MRLISLSAAVVCLIISSCASYLQRSEETRSLLRQGQSQQVLGELKELADKQGRDQLVYLLDYATALQITGEYKESTKYFQKADALIEANDYHSISNIVGATLGSEEMIQYKGESFEKFMLNSLNAINYLLLNDYDSALVECRRINDKISAFKMEGREPYELSPFARYLAGIIWESQKKYDDAYIEYEAAYKLDPTIPTLKKDLLRVAKLSEREQALEMWQKKFSEKPENTNKSLAEIVVIYQQGFGAKKVPRIDEPRFPTLKSEFLQTTLAQIVVSQHIQNNDKLNDKTTNSKEIAKVKTQVVYDIDQMAIRTLDRDYNSLIARRVGALAAKAVVASQVKQKNSALGDIAWIAMNLADRADLRQWSTLPARIQMARIFLQPGTYDLSVFGLDASDAVSQSRTTQEKIVLKPGQKHFVNFRSLR